MKEKSPKSALAQAKMALKKTRNALCLGSSNISKLFYDKATDKPVIYLGLFSSFDSKRRFNLESLSLLEFGIDYRFGITEELKSLSNKRMIQSRGMGRLTYHHHDPEKSAFQNSLDTSLILQAGHCHELSLCTIAMLRQVGYDGRIEFVAFEYFEHVFVVINRPKESSLANWKSWGDKTIVIDPWINECCKGNQFGELWNKEKLRTFFQGNWVNGLQMPPAGLKLIKVKLLAENPSIEINPEIKSQFGR